ncbi:distal tail protein Dit [Thermoactinomyces sp. CICC 23799]|uniref:distal tail protein Dit n=1 Tax=Thermoactinomyces sp. CICC 23799 TaxID=2767429 RepID=UPI0018DEB78E|nr:distal tail protein Dit [Thermoactinomyces sp. CICC 23799]MBH8600139.1 phage tail family protein [Thermoactinomyces sp. CICC 23799]
MFKFKGQHALDYFDKVLEVRRGMTAPSSAVLQKVRGNHGAYFYGVETDIYEIEFDVFLQGESRQDLWQRVRRINTWLRSEHLEKLEVCVEKGLYYKAICVDSLDLDEMLEYGWTTIKFIAPDPFAHGETKVQRVDSPSAIFSRAGIRYREDGTVVTENYPIYKPGKFDQAILVEEGTENLLETASNPQVEELAVVKGADYYLTTVNGSAGIEHKKTEELPVLSLEKEGTDYQGAVDRGWESGTLVGVEEVDNDFLELTKSGVDVEKIFQTTTDWNSGTHHNTRADAGENLELTNILDWEYWSDMYNHVDWTNHNASNTQINQYPEYVEIVKTGGQSQSGGMRKNVSLSFTNGFTMEFRFKTQNANNGISVYVSNGSILANLTLPDTNGEWRMARIRIPAGASAGSIAELYVDGDLHTTYTMTNYSTALILFFFSGVAPTGSSLALDWVIYHQEDRGAPPAGNVYYGYWESPWFDISDAKLVANAYLTPTWTDFDPLPEYFHDVKFHVRRDDNGEVGEWVEVVDAEIVNILEGEDLEENQTKIQVMVELFSIHGADSPDLKSLQIQIHSGYVTSGYRESVPINISQVGKASRAISELTAFIPEGTSVLVETRISTDGGNTWSEYMPVSGNVIQGISQATDLSNGRFQYRVTLTTSRVSLTPSADRLSYEFYSGYVPSKTITLPSVDVSNIGKAITSTAILPQNHGAEATSVIFEYSLDGTTWSKMNHNQAFVEDVDLSDSNLTIRYTLVTEDTNETPTIGDTMTWYIRQQEPNKITPATDIIRLIPNGASRWQLEKRSYPTSWHNTGNRNPEELKVWIDHLTEELNEAGTISMWVYEDGMKRQLQATAFDTTGTESRFHLFKDEETTSYVLEIGGKEAISVPKGSGWNHLAVVWDTSNIYLYLNGEFQGEADRTVYPLNFNGMTYLWLGVSRENSNHWNNLIDDVVIFTRALEAVEVEELFNSNQPATPTEDNNVYHFDGNLAAGSNDILEYLGTYPAYPRFNVQFSRATPYFKISNGSEFILINHEFQPGDKLEIDCANESVKLNTLLIMEDLSIDSDFFAIKNGDQILFDPDGAASVDLEFTERWV